MAQVLQTNKHLEELCISNNALCRDAIQGFARVLQVNQHLKRLDLANCVIMDNGLQCLAKATQHNDVLDRLFLHNNSMISMEMVPVLIKCLQKNHTLTHLSLPNNLKSSIFDISKAVNYVRERRGLLLIQVEGT